MSTIDADKLTSFILFAHWQVDILLIRRSLRCVGRSKESIESIKDSEGSSISDRPGNMVDVFHTHFGIAGVCKSIP